jgi:GDP-mannose 6-dehydrogenase
MRIAVFGLGYVGSVTAACFAKMGHKVIGVDVSELKVDAVNAGHSPVTEDGLEEMMGRAVRQKRLRATLSATEAVTRSDLSLIAVGTPSQADGSVDLGAVKAAARQIGRGLRTVRRFHTVTLRSTVPPGTTAHVVIPLLERASGKKAGRDFGVCFHPEFLREGSSVQDFFHPPKTVIGAGDERCAKVLARLWRPIRAPLFVTSIEVAEMLKYTDNAFHALKICFANEIGSVAKSCGADSRQVMDIFARDTQLNISALYLQPGFAFGGPCLPKDVRALCAVARTNRVALPLVEAILNSNARHLERAARLILATGKKRIGVLGLAFKGGTDDLRESPAVALVRELLRAKRKVSIFDPKIQVERLLGANRAYYESQLPALPRLLASSFEDLLRASDVIVVAENSAEFRNRAPQFKNKIVVDLVHLLPQKEGTGSHYYRLAG